MVKNLKEVFSKFNTEAKCIDFLVKQRWNGVPECPYCGCNRSYVIANGKRFKCANNKCYKKYSVTVGTIMEASNIPLTKWLPAMYIITAHKKGISSVQLAKDLGVTQKTAWFMLHRIREQLKADNSALLSGTVEIDEVYMGRKFASEYKAIDPETSEGMTKQTKHVNKLKKRGAVVGLAHPETGTVRTMVFNARTTEALHTSITQNIAPGSTLYTDEGKGYEGLTGYNRETVNHFLKEWVRGDVTVNHVENFWSVMKRGIYGIYHQVSYKHLQRYCDEFSYRYNSRKLKDGERFIFATQNIEGRLSYKRLVYGKGKENTPQA